MMTFADRENWLIYILTILYLTPVWLFQYFPSQDGPTHLYNAMMIHNYFEPGYELLQEYYLINTKPEPTWFGHLILTALMYVFPPLLAEKIFLTFYVLIFIYAFHYALTSINDKASFLTLLSFPMVYNYTLNAGFYSFSVSLALALIFLGYWFRNRDQWNLWRLCIFGILGLLVYLFHLVSFGMCCGVIGIISFYLIYADLKNGPPLHNVTNNIAWVLKHRVLLPFLALAPTIFLVLYFLYFKETVYEDHPNGFIHKVLAFLTYFHIASIQMLGQYWIGALFVLFIGSFVLYFLWQKIRTRNFIAQDFLIIAAIACTVVFFIVKEPYLVSPNGMSGGGHMLNRVVPFPFFMMILWLAAQTFSMRQKSLMINISLLFAVGLLISNLYITDKVNVQLKEYVSVSEHIEANSTLLFLPSATEGYSEHSGGGLTHRVDPFLHAGDYLGLDKSIVSLSNYEATMGYFPFVYKDEINPYVHIGDMEGEGAINLLDYTEATGGKIDYVLYWLGQKRNTESEKTQSVYQQLNQKYERVYISENGLVELYKAK